MKCSNLIRLKTVCYVVMCSIGDVHKSVTFSCVFMLVQLNKCDVCGSELQRGHSGDGCLSSSILFKYESSKGHFCVLHLIRSLFSSTYNLWFWKTLRSVRIVNLLAEDLYDSLYHELQTDTSGSCGHVILYVLSEVYCVLMYDFQGLKPVCSLMRCPSTIGATFVSIFHRAYTCVIVYYCFYLNKLQFIIESANTPYVFILGHYNADIQSESVFGTELINFCDINSLCFIDSSLLLPDIFTFVSQAHGTTSC